MPNEDLTPDFDAVWIAWETMRLIVLLASGNGDRISLCMPDEEMARSHGGGDFAFLVRGIEDQQVRSRARADSRDGFGTFAVGKPVLMVLVNLCSISSVKPVSIDE